MKKSLSYIVHLFFRVKVLFLYTCYCKYVRNMLYICICIDPISNKCMENRFAEFLISRWNLSRWSAACCEFCSHAYCTRTHLSNGWLSLYRSARVSREHLLNIVPLLSSSERLRTVRETRCTQGKIIRRFVFVGNKKPDDAAKIYGPPFKVHKFLPPREPFHFARTAAHWRRTVQSFDF